MKPEEQAAYDHMLRHVELGMAFGESAHIGTFLAGVKWARENANWTPIKERLPTQSEYERGVEWRMVSYKQESEK